MGARLNADDRPPCPYGQAQEGQGGIRKAPPSPESPFSPPFSCFWRAVGWRAEKKGGGDKDGGLLRWIY